MAAAGFLSRYMSGPVPYVSRHITVKKNVLSASVNNFFSSFQWLMMTTINNNQYYRFGTVVRCRQHIPLGVFTCILILK